MDTFFARQPILDGALRLYGYELLFRPDPSQNTAGSDIVRSGDTATTSVLDAMNWGGIEKISAGSMVFINFTERLLVDGIATLFPKNRLVVEVLETVERTSQVTAALRALKKAGYKLALDDYIFNADDAALLELSDIIKVEVDGSQALYDNLYRVARSVDTRRCILLAEKVETQAVYEQARELGCSLFQGYFFAKPKILHEKLIKPLKINQMRIMRAMADPDVDSFVQNPAVGELGLLCAARQSEKH